jgi:hypothetical protein
MLAMNAIIASNKWTPKRLGDLKYWFSAPKITGLTNGDPLDSWINLSGTGYNAEKITDGQRPRYDTNVLNGQPGVHFVRGENDVLVSTGLTIPQPFTVFIVCSSIYDLGGNCNIINTPTNDVRINKVGDYLSIYAGAALNGFLWSNIYTPALVTAEFNGLNSKIYLNGELKITGNAGTTSLSGLILGNTPEYIRGQNGYIIELFIVGNIPTDAKRNRAHQYIHDMYGITIAA